MDHYGAAPLELNAREHPCECVQRHTPAVHRTQRHHVDPLGWGGPDVDENIVPVCPTTHSEIHLILEGWKRLKHRLGRARGQSPYAYDLARRGWEAAHARGWTP